MKRFQISFNVDIGSEDTSASDIEMWLRDALDKELILFPQNGERVGDIEIQDLGEIQEE